MAWGGCCHLLSPWISTVGQQLVVIVGLLLAFSLFIIASLLFLGPSMVKAHAFIVSSLTTTIVFLGYQIKHLKFKGNGLKWNNDSRKVQSWSNSYLIKRGKKGNKSRINAKVNQNGGLSKSLANFVSVS